ncbi:MotA/TolQ/ExbB proton channel family protein [Brevinematales bacterium NS]|nr:MotA/TolQ/ExbB proton channel family protein [Brevinematales bacterium]QJR22031.1 MotA/TolQ/ExbB proton channel family protein [Brevinematales bacterium NS]
MKQWLWTLLAVVSTGFAQETNLSTIAQEAPSKTVAKVSFMDTLLEFHRMGGVFMYPLYILSVLGLAYVLERFVFYTFRQKLCEEEFLSLCKSEASLSEIEQKVKEGKSRTASVLKEIFRLSSKRKRLEDLDKVLEMELNAHIGELQRGFTMMSAIINLAPLVGFLGTVSGMIGAFRSIALADQVSITLVAKGIYEALITTEVGLVIAITINFFYSLFTQKLERFTQVTMEAGENLIERIVEHESER